MDLCPSTKILYQIYLKWEYVSHIYPWSYGAKNIQPAFPRSGGATKYPDQYEKNMF